MRQSKSKLQKKKLKSASVLDEKINLKFLKQKRNSCVYGRQLEIIEESTKLNIETIMCEILRQVEDKIDENSKLTKNILDIVDDNFNLLNKIDPFSDGFNILQDYQPIILQNQPKTQQNFKVIKEKKTIPINTNKTINNNLEQHHKISQNNKQIKNLTVQNKNNKSINSLRMLKQTKSKGTINNIETKNKIKMPQRQNRSDMKQEIIKRLKKQYEMKKMQKIHTTIQPIQINYRRFFSEPEEKIFEEMREKYLKQLSQNEERKKKSINSIKRSSSLHTNSQSYQTDKSDFKLPSIFRGSQRNQMAKGILGFFAQCQNGEMIKIKKNIKSSDYNVLPLNLENIKFKDNQTMSTYVTQQESIRQPLKSAKLNFNELQNNDSILTVKSRRINDDELERQLLQKIQEKKGVLIKKSSKIFKALNSVVELRKFPSLNEQPR